MKIQREHRSGGLRRPFRHGRPGVGSGFVRGWIFILLIVLPGVAAVPLKDYTERLAQAEILVDQLIEGDHPASQVLSSMTAIKRLLPPQENIEFDGREVRVDNTWLSGAIDQVVENAGGDVEQRRSLLIDLANRLLALRERVKAAQSQLTLNPDDRHAQLDRILARPEYRTEEVKESIVKKWLRKLADALARFWGQLGSASRVGSSGAAGGAVEGLRILILLVVLAASVFGAIYLLKRLRYRRKSSREPGIREVLGEAISEELTASDLLSKATELAQQGDYRAAIRRAYLALLFEMEHRGRLQLHRSKTNRDYLEDLRSAHDIFQPFSAMTWIFEKAWYGQTRATEDEFNGFLSRYRETEARHGDTETRGRGDRAK